MRAEGVRVAEAQNPSSGRVANSKLCDPLPPSADHQTRCEYVCATADIPFLAESEEPVRIDRADEQ